MKKIFLFLALSCACSPVISQPAPSSSVLPKSVSVQSEVVYLSLGKINSLSPFQNKSYLPFTNSGTNIALIVHSPEKLLKFIPDESKLLNFTDNFGTDLIAEGIQQKNTWQAQHSSVVTFGGDTDNGIQFEKSKIMEDGKSFLLPINSNGLPKTSATQLTINANLVFYKLDVTSKIITEDKRNIPLNDKPFQMVVNQQPVKFNINYWENEGENKTAAYQFDSPLAITQIDAFDPTGKVLLGSVIIQSSAQNYLKIKSNIKLVNLRIYYHAQPEKITLPVQVTTGLGI